MAYLVHIHLRYTVFCFRLAETKKNQQNDSDWKELGPAVG